MERLIHSNQLPGGNSSREFEGKDYGAGLTLILVNVETGHGPSLHRHPYEEIFVIHAGTGSFVVNEAVVQGSAGDIVIAPAGTAHRFVNSGSDRLQLTAIHHNAKFVTEWLEPLTPDQRYWSSEHR
jgi:mannose-6-phosphate isomerase-like protein (cupin superfamily)